MFAEPSQWFAIQTMSRHEKRVSLQLKEREIEHFLPLHRTLHYWKNRTRAEVELPLFPSYVFVRTWSDAKGKVLSIPGTLSLVGSSRGPWPLPDEEIETLRAGLEHCKPEPHPYLTVGDRVRIADGPLAGMEGVLTEKKNGPRVILSLQQIMRSISVEVDLRHLQLITRSSRIAC